MNWLTSAALVAALTLGVGYLFFLSQILIHAASHVAVTYNRKLDQLIGQGLSILNFHSFEGWRSLHMLHHQHTNSPGKDPGHPNTGEAHWRYLFTALPKMARFTASRFYLENSRRGVESSRYLSQTSSVPRKMAFIVGQSWEMFLGLTLLAVAGIWAGPAGVLLFWIVPWAIGQMLMADFNFRTHRNCPPKAESRPYVGQDSNTLDSGIWTFINLLTLGMYRHQAHHRNPRICLWWGPRAHSPEVVSSVRSIVPMSPKSRKVSS